MGRNARMRRERIRVKRIRDGAAEGRMAIITEAVFV
jgi:hypothetical protein